MGVAELFGEHDALRKQGCGVAFVREDMRYWHCGIAWSEGSNLRMLHLKWHCDLACEAPGPDALWVRHTIPAERAKQVAAKCRLIWKRHADGRIPFGFSYTATHFDSAGGLVLGGSEVGLTCATFVMAVFSSVGIVLLDHKSWPQRPEDAAWHAFIVHRLRRSGHEGHAMLLEKEIGSVRFRPLEVAGGSAASGVVSTPTTFAYAEAAAKRLEAEYTGE